MCHVTQVSGTLEGGGVMHVVTGTGSLERHSGIIGTSSKARLFNICYPQHSKHYLAPAIALTPGRLQAYQTFFKLVKGAAPYSKCTGTIQQSLVRQRSFISSWEVVHQLLVCGTGP